MQRKGRSVPGLVLLGWVIMEAAAGAGGQPLPAAESTTPRPQTKALAPGMEANWDVKKLTERLRQSPAIGFFTKLALKSEVDDLLDAFRRFHAGQDGQLTELRDRFNLLLMKVISLLQDKDPKLSKDIFSAREVLWAKLVDPKEFSKI